MIFLHQERTKMNHSTLVKSAVAVLGLWAAGFSAAPIEKSGPCPTLTRSNFYNGIDLRAFNNSATTTNNLLNSPGWPIKPPTTLTNAGLIQDPLTPQQSINCVLTPPGLKPQIVASELTPGPASAKPMAYPLSFNFDEKGRLWVVDAVDYPYTHDSSGMPFGSGITTSAGLTTDRLTGKSRILIFTDTDGDGSLDNFKIFYEGFALANSLEFVKGGIIVMVPPNVYYVPRSTTNPDTAGGAPVIVVSGLGSNSTNYDSHGQPNSISRNVDNWIYGHTGYNGCGTTGAGISNAPGGSSRTGSCGNGNSYRFKHSLFASDTSRFEVRSGGQANAHGLSFMEDGQVFKSAATGSTHNQHDVRPGVTALDIRLSSGSARRDRTRLYSLTNDRYMWEGNNDTITPAPGSGDVTYYSTGISAVSGSDFYTARLLPQKYWNRFQFACEGMSGLCNQDSLTINGSTWSSNRLYPGDKWPNIYASSDAWSAPLLARTGPDGALWVLDFYNYVFLHNPATPSTNAAYRHPLRYKTRSRFYRILPENGATDPILNLTNATTSQLVATFSNTNLVWRLHAQRLLIEQGYTTELGTLLQNILTTRRSSDAVETDAPVLHALWTLEGLKQFADNPTRWDPILKQLLLHPAWTVRRNVLLAMPSTAASFEAIRTQCAADDVHPHVRLQALDNLNRMPVSGALPTIMGGSVRVDTYSTGAFNSANTGTVHIDSVTGASGRPGTCPAYLGVVGIKDAPSASMPYLFSRDVRFDVHARGFNLLANGDLPSGELVVFDLSGKVAFRSVWNQSALKWSTPEARNLAQPVYFYNFRGTEGQTFKGRIALGSQF
jgi:putative membrane-bound dehydrogenase-like protein